MIQIIAQSIGFIALALVFLSYQFNKRSTILLFLILVQILFVIHYGLLGAWIGSAMNLVSAIRTYIFKQRENHSWANQRFWPYLFMSISWLSGIFTWNSLLCILPIIAMTIDTWVAWTLKPKTIRFLTLIPRPMWFIYDITVHSYPGLIGETVTFVSVLIGIIRFDILHKNNSIK